jgi:hypothetical protein
MARPITGILLSSQFSSDARSGDETRLAAVGICAVLTVHFAHHTAQVMQRLSTITDEGRPVHGRQSLRLQGSQLLQQALGLRGKGHVIHQQPTLIFDQSLASAPDNVRLGEQLNISILVKQIRAE